MYPCNLFLECFGKSYFLGKGYLKYYTWLICLCFANTEDQDVWYSLILEDKTNNTKAYWVIIALGSGWERDIHSKFRVDYVDNGEKTGNMILDRCTNVDIHVCRL